MQKSRSTWLRMFMGTGVALGLLLLFEAIFSYRDVVGNLVIDHIKSQAGLVASSVERQISGPDFPSAKELSRPARANEASPTRCCRMDSRD